SEPAVELLKADTSAHRIFGLPGTYERSFMQYHGIETTDGWTDHEYRLYREFRGGDYQQNPNLMGGLKQNPDGSVSGSPFLATLNVKNLAYRLPGEGGIRLAPNTTVLPRAWFVSAWDTLPETDVLERMKAPDFDPRRLAYLSGSGLAPKTPSARTADSAGEDAPGQDADPAAAVDLAESPATVGAAIQRISGGYNRSAWTVTAPQEGLLVLSELWFPHWRVEVDGKPAELLRTNFAFQGVKLEAGEHRVVLSYHSPWRNFGFMIGLLSAVLLAAFLGGLRFLAPRLEKV